LLTPESYPRLSLTVKYSVAIWTMPLSLLDPYGTEEAPFQTDSTTC
jgi:hypothetical protein